MVFRSPLVPPYVRRARSIEAALPWLYLHGVSTGDMAEALEVLVGPHARGLSAGGQPAEADMVRGIRRLAQAALGPGSLGVSVG